MSELSENNLWKSYIALGHSGCTRRPVNLPVNHIESFHPTPGLSSPHLISQA